MRGFIIQRKAHYNHTTTILYHVVLNNFKMNIFKSTFSNKILNSQGKREGFI